MIIIIIIIILIIIIIILIITIMDRFREKKKTALCFLYLSSGVILVFCSLLAEDVIIMANDAIFKSLLSCLLVLGISLATAAAPIATEFCVDLCRPVSEENIGNLSKAEIGVLELNDQKRPANLCISGSWLTLWFNLVALVFFLAFQIPGVRNSPLSQQESTVVPLFTNRGTAVLSSSSKSI